MKLSLLASLGAFAAFALAGVIPQEPSVNSTEIEGQSLEGRQTGTPPGCGLRGGVPKKHCFCDGAVEFGHIINDGIEAICNRWAWRNVQPGQELHELWCRTGEPSNGDCPASNTIHYFFRYGPNCPVAYPILPSVCKSMMYEVKDTCAWSFDSHKGGYHLEEFGSCWFKFEFDVNA